MSLEPKIREDLKKAQKALDAVRVSTLRLLLAKLTNEKIALRRDSLTDEEELKNIKSEIKKRKEAAEMYRAGGRAESAEKENLEKSILEEYVPAEMNDDELLAVINEVKNSLGAVDKSAFGKVMGQVMAKVGGRADGGRVKVLIERVLGA